MPAFADPAGAPLEPFAPAVPDVGSRPMALGTVVLPGQRPTGTPNPTPTLAGVATSPILQRIEKGRAEIAAVGDQLIQLGQDRDLARDQHTAAGKKLTEADAALRAAQTAAAEAAVAAVREAAAMPPGSADSLLGLNDLARMQRGDGGTQQAAARQLELTQVTAQLALDEQTLSEQRYTGLAKQYNKLNAELTRKQSVQQAFELAHSAELAAAEAWQSAADSRLGAEYLAGAEAGRGADARALRALAFALAQRGDPYVWSEEGPDQYDCSGLMWAAYRSVGFELDRVSRDQYWQTHERVVDRYSLLPGDLLFFSYSNSWRGIHHVAMYAGNGMMIEAPRTGLNVRLTPVRWSRLFQATRVFGSIEGVTDVPELGAPDPDPTTAPGTGNPTTPPTATTRPTPTPTTAPTTPPSSTPPSSTPSATPPSSTPPSSTPPSSATPSPTSDPTTPAPSATPTSVPSGGESAGGESSGGSASSGSTSDPASSEPTGATSTSSATATEAASTSN